jgi:hypothetical protein
MTIHGSETQISAFEECLSLEHASDPTFDWKIAWNGIFIEDWRHMLIQKRKKMHILTHGKRPNPENRSC